MQTQHVSIATHPLRSSTPMNVEIPVVAAVEPPTDPTVKVVPPPWFRVARGVFRGSWVLLFVAVGLAGLTYHVERKRAVATAAPPSPAVEIPIPIAPTSTCATPVAPTSSVAASASANRKN